MAHNVDYCSYLRYYSDVIMGAMTSQITSLTIVYSPVYSGTDQRTYQSSASMAFVRGIHRWPVNFPHKWPVTRKMFPFDDVIMDYPTDVTGVFLQACTPTHILSKGQLTLSSTPSKQCFLNTLRPEQTSENICGRNFQKRVQISNWIQILQNFVPGDLIANNS